MSPLPGNAKLTALSLFEWCRQADGSGGGMIAAGPG
jgi:hypothetical protein